MPDREPMIVFVGIVLDASEPMAAFDRLYDCNPHRAVTEDGNAYKAAYSALGLDALAELYVAPPEVAEIAKARAALKTREGGA